MEVKFTRTKAGTILWGIASILLGIVVFLNPGASAEVLTEVTGWVLTIFGVVSLVGAFTNRSIILSNIDLYNGAISLLFGLLILASPAFFMTWIFVLLGIYIIFTGLSSLMGANALRVVGLPGAGGGMIAAILAIVLGFMVIGSPFAAAGATMIICGIALVYTGIVHVVEGVRMPKQEE